MQQLVFLALHHSGYGYSRPSAHHLGNVVGSHLLAHQSALSRTRLLRQFLLYAPDVLLQSLQVAISYLCHSLVVALTFGSLSLKLQLLHLLLVLLNLVHQFLLALPFGSEGVLLLTQLGNLFVQLCQLRLVVLAFYRLAFYLQLCQLTRYLVQLLRHAVTLHPQLCCRLVHQVYRLVGQETVGDVSLRELHGSDAGIILYTYLVMVLVSLLQTSQYGDGAQLVRLVHHHRLEPSLQRLVLLKVFLVFVQRRGAYGTQLATSQRRLQHPSHPRRRRHPPACVSRR